MPFAIHLLEDAEEEFLEIKAAALKAQSTRAQSKRTKTSRQEGLYKQIVKCLTLLQNNPRHPGLHTHQLSTIEHPYVDGQPVFEAYVQNKTPGAYRIFWCYGPHKNEISVVAITPHP